MTDEIARAVRVMSDVEARLRRLEAEMFNVRNSGVTDFPVRSGFKIAKYTEAAVDALLAKYNQPTLAALDRYISDLKEVLGNYMRADTDQKVWDPQRHTR